MSESYGSLPTPIEALRNLLTQVENCDGTAQIDTNEAEAVLNAQQQGPTRLRTERRDGPFGPFDLLVAPVLREVDGAVVDTGERESLMIDSIRPIPLIERMPEPKDMDGGLAWAGFKAPGLPYWEWTVDDLYNRCSTGYTHWLPASTKYLPARIEE